MSQGLKNLKDLLYSSSLNSETHEMVSSNNILLLKYMDIHNLVFLSILSGSWCVLVSLFSSVHFSKASLGNSRFKVQGSCLFVTYTIIQGIISSEMEVRTGPLNGQCKKNKNKR